MAGTDFYQFTELPGRIAPAGQARLQLAAGLGEPAQRVIRDAVLLGQLTDVDLTERRCRRDRRRDRRASEVYIRSATGIDWPKSACTCCRSPCVAQPATLDEIDGLRAALRQMTRKQNTLS